MFGVIGKNPQMLKAIIPVFGSFFAQGSVEPHIHEMMRLKTGQETEVDPLFVGQYIGIAVDHLPWPHSVGRSVIAKADHLAGVRINLEDGSLQSFRDGTQRLFCSL